MFSCSCVRSPLLCLHWGSVSFLSAVVHRAGQGFGQAPQWPRHPDLARRRASCAGICDPAVFLPIFPCLAVVSSTGETARPCLALAPQVADQPFCDREWTSFSWPRLPVALPRAVLTSDDVCLDLAREGEGGGPCPEKTRCLSPPLLRLAMDRGLLPRYSFVLLCWLLSLSFRLGSLSEGHPRPIVEMCARGFSRAGTPSTNTARASPQPTPMSSTLNVG